jgi:tetratricopeptide (TPR) repeat protein
MLLDYWPLNRCQKVFDEPAIGLNLAGKLLWEKVPFIFLVIATSIITFWAQNEKGTVASVGIIPLLTRCANAMTSYAAYLGKTFWPFNLAIYYPYELPLPLWKVLISAIIIILTTFAVLYYIKKLPFLFVGWFIYLGTLIPVIGLVQVGSQAMADRYTNMPSIGIAIGLAWGIPLLFPNNDKRKKIFFPAGIAIIIFLSALSWNQCGYWKDSITLFNHTLSVTRDNPLVHNQLGLAYFEKNKNEKALYHYNKAIIQQPVYDNAYNNRGAVYLKFGQYQHALNDFNKTIALNPAYTSAYNNRANIYAHSGQYNLAIEDLSKAIHLNPAYINAYYNRGFLFAKLGYYQKAIEDFNKVISLKPNDTNSYKNRAFVYFKQGDNISGCQDTKKVCELGNCQLLELTKENGLCR